MTTPARVWVCGKRPTENELAWVIHTVQATEEGGRDFLERIILDRDLRSDPDFHMGDDGDKNWVVQAKGERWSAEWFEVGFG